MKTKSTASPDTLTLTADEAAELSGLRATIQNALQTRTDAIARAAALRGERAPLEAEVARIDAGDFDPETVTHAGLAAHYADRRASLAIMAATIARDEASATGQELKILSFVESAACLLKQSGVRVIDLARTQFSEAMEKLFGENCFTNDHYFMGQRAQMEGRTLSFLIGVARQGRGVSLDGPNSYKIAPAIRAEQALAVIDDVLAEYEAAEGAKA